MINLAADQWLEGSAGVIRIVCPNCNSRLRGPDSYAGRAPRCPVCKKHAPAPRTAPPPDIPNDILEEASKPEAEAPKAKARPRPATRRRSRSWTPRWRGAITTAVAVLVVACAAVYVIALVKGKIRERRAQDAYAQIKPDLDELMGMKAAAERLVGEKKYAEAKQAYENALSKTRALRNTAKDLRAPLGESETAKKLDNIMSQLDGMQKSIGRALESDAIRLGSKGYKEYEGQWYELDEWHRLMDYVKYQGEWLTRDEYHRRLGYVKYEGKWYSKRDYEKLKAEEEARRKREEAEAKERAEEYKKRLGAIEAEKKRLAEEKRRKEELKREKYPPDAESWIVDDFEGEIAWSPEKWSRPLRARAVSKDDNRELVIVMAAGGSENCWACGKDIDVDMTSRDTITMDVFNEMDKKVKLSIALSTDNYYESQPKQISSGVNRGLSFPIRTSDFKFESGGEQLAGSVSQLSNVRRLTIVIYADEGGRIRVDNIAATRSK